MAKKDKKDYSIPDRYKPLSPWAYFGYSVLFLVPLVGLISIIVFSFDSSNINRRNFSRAFFLIFAVVVIAVIFYLAFGEVDPSLEEFLMENGKKNKTAKRSVNPFVLRFSDLLFHRSTDFKLFPVSEKH